MAGSLLMKFIFLRCFRKKLLACLPPIDGITNKTMASVIQMTCYKGEIVNVYAFDKEPLLFRIEEGGILYPTVYLTWRLPEAFPVLVTHEEVYRKLIRGADLYLQGVIRPLRETSEFSKYAPVAISIQTADKLRGPVAIGYSLMSSMEMIANGMQGPGVRLLHFHGDLLWETGSRAQPLEVPVERRTLTTSPGSYEREFPALGSLTMDEKVAEAPDKAVDGCSLMDAIKDAGQEGDNESTVVLQEQAEEELQSTDSMESLLKRCFLAALKCRVTKKGQLPLDVGEFYSRHLLPCVPSDRRIDMKKTVYKKFSVFLDDINKDENGPVVKLIAKHKGSEMIAEVNWEHPLLKNFKTTDEKIDDAKSEAKKMVKVDEYLAVTEPVSAIFRDRCEKGGLLTRSQVREIITTYVKSRNPDTRDKVTPSDDLLVSLLQTREPVDWNTLFQKITSKMTKTYVITWPDGRQVVRKLELPKIVFKIENRAGNKKVTMVNNLSIYGIDCRKFCHEIQTGVATSASIVNDAVQCEGPQVLVQGNQILFISNLILSKYGVDKKYMIGLELIPKKR